MAITDDLRKTLSDPTPLYFAAGTADLAFQQAKRVPALVEQLRTEAPARFEAVRNTDPKAVQEQATTRAKEAGAKAKEAQETFQTKVNEFVSSLDADIKKFGSNLDADFKKFGNSLDTDLKKFGESAQDLALRTLGVAAEYAVKARETYEKVAEHGEQAVKTWRGEAAEEIEELAVAVEPKAEPVEVKEDKPAAARTETKAGAGTEAAPAKKTAAKKAPARKTTAKKTTPPAK
jgi:heparin binding hemagglutinin HbhA